MQNDLHESPSTNPGCRSDHKRPGSWSVVPRPLGRVFARSLSPAALAAVAGASLLGAFTPAATAQGCSQEWRLANSSSLPPRQEMSMAYDEARDRAVVFGGLSGFSYLQDTWEWDGGSWTQQQPSGSIPSRRRAAAMVYDAARGVTVLFGGRDGSGTALSDTWQWDGTSWTEAMIAGPTGRSLAAFAYDPVRQVIVVFGGGGTSSNLADTWEYDGTSWTQVATTGPGARYGAAMSYDATRGVMVLFGGSHGSTETWEWNGSSWTRVLTGASPDARRNHRMVFDPRCNKTVLYGGALFSVFDDTWEYDGATWTQAAPGGPGARRDFGMAFDSLRGRIVLAGGSTTSDETWVRGGVTTFGGLDHFALGSAVLNVVPAGLEVSNIGPSGDEGVEVMMPLRQSPGFGHELKVSPPWPPAAGASLKITAMGEVGGVVQPVGTLRTDFTGNGAKLSADFSALGGATELVAYNHGKPVWRGPVQGVTVVIEVPTLVCNKVTLSAGASTSGGASVGVAIECNIVWKKVTITVSIGSVAFEATDLQFQSTNWTMLPTLSTSTRVQAAQLSSFTIGSEATLAGVQYGEGLGGANTLQLTGTGSSFLGETFSANTSPVTGSAFTFLSVRPAQLPIFGGNLLVDLTGPTVTVNTAAVNGTATQPISIPNFPALVGQSVYLQSAVLDPTQPLGLAFSQGNELRIVQ